MTNESFHIIYGNYNRYLYRHDLQSHGHFGSHGNLVKYLRDALGQFKILGVHSRHDQNAVSGVNAEFRYRADLAVHARDEDIVLVGTVGRSSDSLPSSWRNRRSRPWAA